jgi:hypothetical protein
VNTRIVVGFPYEGEDGTPRTPGDLVNVSAAEFARRGPAGDAYCREATGADQADQAPADDDPAPEKARKR